MGLALKVARRFLARDQYFVGPSYNEAEVCITAHGAQTMLKRNEIAEDVAQSWGRTLVEALGEPG